VDDVTSRLLAVLVALVCAVAPAAAGPDARVPDASLRAVKDRVVRLELDGGAPAIEGRLLAFEADTVTIAIAGTKEVVTVERSALARVIALETAEPPASPPAPEKLRVVGLQISLLGTIAVDADYKYLRGFASTNLLLPILTASGDSRWMAAAIGGGASFELGSSRRWRLDVFGEVLPLRTTSHYTYVGFGIGAGLHYTSRSGFTLGVTFPVIGFSTRVGSSPTGYDPAFRYNDSLKYFYFAGLAGMPLLTLGYRFSTNCPRPDR
jgi:hypothetical protein